jgi:thioredoxin-dependent peroxiredoxin
MASSVKVGDQAPDFSLPASDGRTIRLGDYRGKSEVVLFFYPKDDSPACSAEACSFRDSHEDFLEAGAVVIGVSSDPAGEHQAFASKHRLPFPLLTDAKGALRTLYGVPKTLGLIPGRVTYLIDREGIVRQITSAQLRPLSHIKEALKALKEIRNRSDAEPQQSNK